MTLALPLQSTSPDLYYGKYVAGMFANGEQGVWYDPSDMSTLFQDSAGTVPVTGVEQQVGFIKDKSGRGNHARQTVSTGNRPTLSARYNLLTNTEQFDSWSRYQVTMSANYITGPFGRTTADLFVADTNYGEHVFWQSINFTAGVRYKFLIYLKNHTTSTGIYRFNDNSAFNYVAYVDINLNTGTITGGSGASNVKLEHVGNGWYKAEFTAVATSTQAGTVRLNIRSSSGAILYNGDGISGVYVGGCDVRVANESANLPAYQRVNTATDYDTNGFPPYLRFDGVDDWLVTPSINFTGTDKMTVFAGVRKLSDAASGIVVELSSDVSVLPGSFQVAAPGAGGADKFRFISRGSTAASVGALTTSSVYSAPSTQIICGIADIAADIQRLRLNWQIINANSSDQGSGSFGNYPLYVGTRGVVNLPFNGRLYGLIVRGAQTDDLHLTNTERYLAYKTGVAL